MDIINIGILTLSDRASSGIYEDKATAEIERVLNSYIKNDGYDSVATRRSTRKGEPPIRSFFARLFYKIMNRISKTELVEGARDFRLMTRRMVDSVLSVC